MQIDSNGQDLLTSNFSNFPVFTTKKVVNYENLFYPKEKGVYKFDRISQDSPELLLSAKNEDALFYRITFSKACGKNGLSIHSHFINEMKQFLLQNDIPMSHGWIPMYHGWDEDYQYHDYPFLDTPYAEYNTTNQEVRNKLLNILLEVNRFHINSTEKNWIAEFAGLKIV